MFLKVVFLILLVVGISFIVYTAYQLIREARRTPEQRTSLAAGWLHAVEVVIGLFLSVLAYFGFRWAQKRQQQLAVRRPGA